MTCTGEQGVRFPENHAALSEVDQEEVEAVHRGVPPQEIADRESGLQIQAEFFQNFQT